MVALGITLSISNAHATTADDAYIADYANGVKHDSQYNFSNT
jgi:hypothetical protein